MQVSKGLIGQVDSAAGAASVFTTSSMNPDEASKARRTSTVFHPLERLRADGEPCTKVRHAESALNSRGMKPGRTAPA